MYRKNIPTLEWNPITWLNEEVVNFYLQVLVERAQLRANDGYPKVYAFDSFFVKRLYEVGYGG